MRELENMVQRLAALYSQEVISLDVIDTELAETNPAAAPVQEPVNEGLSAAVERHLGVRRGA